MILKFADGTEIETPQKTGSIVEFIYRNYPSRLREYCDYIERNNRAFRYIDFVMKLEK